MRRPLFRIVATGCLGFVAAITWHGAGRAAPTASERAAATQLYDDAGKLMEQRQYATACTKYAESQRLDPQLGTLLHLADCYEKSGWTASAWVSFRDASELAATKQDRRASLASSRAAALEQKLVRVVLSVDVGNQAPGLEVQRNGQAVSSGIWGSAVPIDPGTHTYTATAPGFRTWTTSITISDKGGTVRVTVPKLDRDDAAAPAAVVVPPAAGPLTAAAPSASLPALPSSPIAERGAEGNTAPSRTTAPAVAGGPEPRSNPAGDVGTEGGGHGQRTIGYVTGGVGILAIGAGVAFGLVRTAKLGERDLLCAGDVCRSSAEKAQFDQTTSDARSAATLATIGLVGGGLPRWQEWCSFSPPRAPVIRSPSSHGSRTWLLVAA